MVSFGICRIIRFCCSCTSALGQALSRQLQRTEDNVAPTLRAYSWLEMVEEGTQAGQEFRKFPPLLDRVLVERSAAKTVTKGHIMLPEKPQGKAWYMTIVAVGSGSKGKCGGIQPVSMKVGDKFLLPKYGGTKVVLDNKDYFLFRDRDILRKHID
ncbi:10 kDa heat shock protein, mitochondrial-like [Mustela lutreola]|uniref:10 kDa heat shock protein, mitochondrial-like n=1 Tax=Mustela lutreola TaxID=9666 RepID=UPI00279794F3|nr:10 kDa heat shock protein, mitochondrial-like [Mustela lutreola]